MKRIEFGQDAPRGFSWARATSHGRKLHIAKAEAYQTTAVCGVYIFDAIGQPEHMSGHLCRDCEKAMVRCAICAEFIRPGEAPHVWVHVHTGEAHCGTGDGSVAYPSTRSAL